MQAARGLLDADGHELSAAVLERVSDTLHAAALDPAAREQVRAGCLERELRHAGLGLGASVFAPAAPATTVSKLSATLDGTAEQAEAHRRAMREREAARKAARGEENAARRRVERSEAALRAAQQRRERAAGALAAADEALAATESEVREAAAEHERARAELKRL